MFLQRPAFNALQAPHHTRLNRGRLTRAPPNTAVAPFFFATYHADKRAAANLVFIYLFWTALPFGEQAT